MSKDDVSIFQLRLLSSNFKIYMHSCYALLLLLKVYGQLIGSNLHPTYHQSADSASVDVGLHVGFCNYKCSYNHPVDFCLSLDLIIFSLEQGPPIICQMMNYNHDIQPHENTVITCVSVKHYLSVKKSY